MKAVKIISKVIRIILTIVLLVIFVFVIAQRVSKGKIDLLGYQAYTVVTGSMTPKIEVGDIIVIEKVDPASLKKGDVVTYEGSKGDLKGLVLTHRIVDIKKDEEDNKYHFITKGDANDTEDPEITEDNIRGKMIYKSVLFSFVSKLMLRPGFFYGLFVIISIYFIYQVLSMILSKDDDDDEEEGDRKKSK